MLTQFKISRVGAGLAVATLLLAPVSPASAQGTPASRWDAFTGCWAPAQAPAGAAAASLLCIVPSTGASAADLVTISHGKEIGRQHVEANDAVINNTRDGCTGWDRATWSDDAERLYLTANYTCPDGRRQIASGLIGMTANGELVNVQGLDAGKNKGVRVATYVSYNDVDSLPADIASAVQTPSMSVNAARVAASAPLRTDDVIEASHHLDAPVVEAWLANHGDQVSVDGDQLVEMANGGVPGDVTDVMVALSNPDKFQLNPALGGGNPNAYGSQISTGRLNGVASADSARVRGPMCPYTAYGWDYNMRCYYASAYGMSAFDPYWMYRGYYPYGYSPYYGFGYGYGYGYAGWGYNGGWYGGSPVIVVTPSNNNSGYSHGRVVKGRGYVSGAPRSGGSSSGQSSPPPSSSSAGSSSSGSSAGSSAGSTQRTAHRRGGGGI